MDKNNEINFVEKELMMIPNSNFLKDFTESYRSWLLEKYKMMIFDNCDDDLIDDLMREAVMIMDASEEEILKMFFEDAQDKYDDVDEEVYLSQLFEAATYLPKN
ncbi:hypothetical protein [Lysinibacillus capsici]|uniref:hypothetical protein n=1 Tax=Lysinibacillus capsici TaxID=2115968 RepID=UPI002E240143|nr:hypothetical protein [Lysinibacillus capsici]